MGSPAQVTEFLFRANIDLDLSASDAGKDPEHTDRDQDLHLSRS